jgi:hypothetical protein
MTIVLSVWLTGMFFFLLKLVVGLESFRRADFWTFLGAWFAAWFITAWVPAIIIYAIWTYL